MKKNTKKNLAKSLAKYGAFSLAIAGVADASGQIVYTDIDDVVLGNGGSADAFQLDMNADGDPDVLMDQFEFGGNPLIQADAGFAGTVMGKGIATFESLGYNYASRFSSGSVIDANLSFNTGGTMNYNYCGQGANNQQWCGQNIDGYLGIQFSAGANTHYGWIRIDNDGPLSMTIKDFAFESTPDTQILTGDMGNLGTADQNFNGFNQFVANNNLNLSANTSMNNVVIYDITGKQVISQDLNATKANVNLSGLNTGVYIARVTIEGSEKSFKFVK